jgi:hypothetical protein
MLSTAPENARRKIGPSTRNTAEKSKVKTAKKKRKRKSVKM